MNSLWANLYDRHKDRRYAILFVATLFVFFGLAVPAVILLLYLRPFWPPLQDLLPGTGLFIAAMAALIWRAVRRTRSSRNRPKSMPLSRDELRKARSKLLKEQQRHERSLHFGSGGDCSMAGFQRGSGGGSNFARVSDRQRNR